MSFTLAKLSRYTNTRVAGDAACEIDHIDSLRHAGAGAIAFFSNPRFKQQLQETHASAVILEEKFIDLCPAHALITNNPRTVFAKIAALLHPLPEPVAGIDSTAIVSDTAKVGENTYIGPYSVIDENCVIGKNSYIGSNCMIHASCTLGEGCRLVNHVTLCDQTSLGERVILHPGAIIGNDGFGFDKDEQDDNKWIKMPQLGSVQIGDDVEIGANTTIDRGSLRDDITIVAKGVKLDNQIHIAHNVKIGAHTLIAGCVGIAGSTTIGKHCTIGGGVAISDHLQIADEVVLGGRTRVARSIQEAGVYVSGTPVQPYQKWLRSSVLFNMLDELVARIKKLEKHEKR